MGKSGRENHIPDAAVDRIGRSLSAIQSSISKRETAEIALLTQQNLTVSEVHTLTAISAEDVCPMRRVAEQLGVTLSTLTISINRLVVKGYVNRIRSENDQRVVFLNLTPKGIEIVTAHAAFHDALIRELLGDLSANEALALANGLAGLAERS